MILAGNKIRSFNSLPFFNKEKKKWQEGLVRLFDFCQALLMFIATKLELFSLKMRLIQQFLICPEIHLGQVGNEKKNQTDKST